MGKRRIETTAAPPRAGDRLLAAGAIGLGGTATLARAIGATMDPALDAAQIVRIEALATRLDCVVDAAALARATADLDRQHSVPLGEGGLLAALHALCERHQLRARIDPGRIPLHVWTARICDRLALQPLALASPGALLVAAEPACAQRIVRAWEDAGISGAAIGTLDAAVPDGGGEAPVALAMGGSRVPLPAPARDELLRAIAEHGNELERRDAAAGPTS